MIKGKDYIGGWLLGYSKKICWRLCSFFVNKKLATSIKRYLSQSEKDVSKFENTNIFYISPSRKLNIPLSLDNKRGHLENSFQLGFEDIRSSSKLKLFYQEFL